MAASEEELRERLQTTKGGSSETELNELTVKPTGGWPGKEAVMTVTPVGNRPSADLKKLESKSGDEACILGRDPSKCPAVGARGHVCETIMQT